MFTANFWRDAIERAIRTAAQALIGILGAGATGLLDIDWPAALSAAGLAALLSLLTSIVASGVGTKGTAALVPLRKTKSRRTTTRS
ncbi:MAG: holin [Actinomadura sp.]